MLFWREAQPSYQPALAQVRERVVADYRENERRKRFAELGPILRHLLVARLKAGDDFAKAATAVADPAQPKLEVKVYPPFTRRQPPENLSATALNALEGLESGQVSDMRIAEDKGYIVYVQERKLPDLAENSALFAATRARLAQLTAGYDQDLYLSEITAQELKKSESAAR